MTSLNASSELSTSQFQAYLDSLHDPISDLHRTIQAIHDLIPHLTTTISPTGTRLISFTNATPTTNKNTTRFPHLSGTANLNTLGATYLTTARRCTTEHAPFKARLLHISIEKPIYDLYCKSEDLLQAGLNDGSVKFPPPDLDEAGMCPCCRGDPDATILCALHYNDALYYEEDEYRRIWGEEASCGSMSGRDLSWLMASAEQVERKVKEMEMEGKGEGEGVESKL